MTETAQYNITANKIITALLTSHIITPDYSEFVLKAATPNYIALCAQDKPSRVLRLVRSVLGFIAEATEFDALSYDIDATQEDFESEAGDTLFWFDNIVTLFHHYIDTPDIPAKFVTTNDMLSSLEKWTRKPEENVALLHTIYAGILRRFEVLFSSYLRERHIVVNDFTDLRCALENLATSNMQKLTASPRL